MNNTRTRPSDGRTTSLRRTRVGPFSLDEAVVLPEEGPADLTVLPMAEVARRFVQAVLHNQRYIAIFAREEKNLLPEDFRRISDMRREFDRKLVKLLDEGVAAGEFVLADTQMAALAIGGMASWAYVWYRPDGRLSLEAVSEELTNLVLGMAGIRRPAQAREEQRASRTPARMGVPDRRPAKAGKAGAKRTKA